jgi:hypothetical protein
MRLVPDVYSVERDTGFLETALRNSESLPLDADIEIPGFNELYGGVMLKWLESQSRGLATAAQREAFRAHCFQFFSDFPGDTADPSTPEHYIWRALQGFLDTLSGSDGRNFLRLKFLSIKWDDLFFQEILFEDSFQHPTPILQELCLWSVPSDTGRVLQSFAPHAPNLIRLNTNFWIDDRYLLASDQLVELDLTVVEDDYRILLNHANSIERLSLYYNTYSVRRFSHIPLVELDFPHLVELDLRQYSTRQFQCSFRRFPNLKILRCLNDDADTSIKEVNKLLLNTPQLKKLCLWPPKQYTASNANEFGDAVDGLPFLEEICVLYKSESDSLDNFVDSITSRNSRIDVWTIEVTEDLGDGLWWNDELRAQI